MAKEMLINVSEGEECRIALLEDGKLEELYMERTSSTSHVGNIYKGRVTNVEPSASRRRSSTSVWGATDSCTSPI